MFTYALEAFDVAPILALCSPLKRCGKTTTEEVSIALAHRPLAATNITVAALYRTVECFAPTLIVDEADTCLLTNLALRGVLNSGHTRATAVVVRTAGHEPRLFSTWGARMIALIGRLPATLEDRAIVLPMRRRALPERVEVCDVSNGPVVKLATERKHLTTLITRLAFQAESDILAFLRPHYARSDEEGRTLLHELFRAAADLDVTDVELRVTLQPVSSPHRTLAVQALCNTLTETTTAFPGSRLSLRFAIHPRPQIGLAFPGPRSVPPPAAP